MIKNNTADLISFLEKSVSPYHTTAEAIRLMDESGFTALEQNKPWKLEKGGNSFKTIVVDLVNDTYEFCRLFMYDKLKITHESDDSRGAWDKVRTEYLSTMRRVLHLPYENIILLSHEDATKDLTKKTGEKITSVKPKMADKVADSLAIKTSSLVASSLNCF